MTTRFGAGDRSTESIITFAIFAGSPGAVEDSAPGPRADSARFRIPRAGVPLYASMAGAKGAVAPKSVRIWPASKIVASIPNGATSSAVDSMKPSIFHYEAT